MRKQIKIVGFLVLSIRIARQYIDPNTGGMLFQLLAVLFGLFSGALLFFSGRIRMAIARIRRRFRDSEDVTTAGVESSATELE